METFGNIMLKAHSGLRWFALIMLIYAVVNALMKRSKEYKDGDKTVSVITLSLVHLQVVIGLVLYFVESRQNGLSEMSDSVTRLYSLEHPLMMLIAAVLITIGHSKAKKAAESAKKFKSTYVFFGIGLLLILSRIPWPFLPGLSEIAHWF